ncbi:MAG: glycosyltransferase family 4 protein, partial [Gemmataceae bacterium]|nr:glycosyltransferase family 4 protein [Gemmataceae bacterium]
AAHPDPGTRPVSAPDAPTQGRLRIALLVHEYNRWMGHSRYTAELAARFKKEHDVHVFTNAVEEPDPTGITFHHVPMWRANALTNIVSFILPATIIARGRFDIVHAQGLCGLRQNVVTAHICQPAWYAAGAQYAPETGWRKRVFRAVALGLDRLVMRRAAAARFIAPSARVKADLDAHYGLGDAVRVVFHGTDTDTFHPRNRERWRAPVRAELGLRPDECVALYVGDLRKAMPASIRATARVPGVKLVAVSRSDPAPDLTLAADLGVADRVIFAPPAGAAELVAHGVNGWVTADPWNPDQIAEGVRCLAADPALREKMGNAARVAVEAYTWDRTAAETMSVYREVVAARRSRSGSPVHV